MMADRFCPIMIRALIRRIVASVSDGSTFHSTPVGAPDVHAGRDCNEAWIRTIARWTSGCATSRPIGSRAARTLAVQAPAGEESCNSG